MGSRTQLGVSLVSHSCKGRALGLWVPVNVLTWGAQHRDCEGSQAFLDSTRRVPRGREQTWGGLVVCLFSGSPKALGCPALVIVTHCMLKGRNPIFGGLRNEGA